ncbi:hypothetical protein EB235_29475 [Mesorhizobium loti R88b]|uniref:Uncharacterized protein n=1 Tax=Mesorhizobium loti R88b TaxID=935548 RepID=A0A6M7WT10_RHILI|nr:hypothetical protein EB235_29475 [Mesorhizobium loti R88b]
MHAYALFARARWQPAKVRAMINFLVERLCSLLRLRAPGTDRVSRLQLVRHLYWIDNRKASKRLQRES